MHLNPTDPDGEARSRAQTLADFLSLTVLDPDDPKDRSWLDAVQAVPRHLFVPKRAWAQPQDNRPDHLIDIDDTPKAWWDAVYSNCAIITQRGDGHADIADPRAPATSSLSSPYVAAEFLHLLDLDRHHRVLEIGTGTGWTAAMIGHLVGDDRVTTIEVDEYVATEATANLKAAGHTPTQLLGDGARGAPDGALYDRMHVTCGVRDIPHDWIDQTRPGGAIVLPWMPPYGGWGEQLRLDVLDDGSAIGHFHGGCHYMMMRSQRTPAWPPYSDSGTKSTTRLDPRTAWAALDHGFGLHLAMFAPHLTITTAGWEEDAWVMRLRDLTGPAWALVMVHPDVDPQVTQSRPGSLWTDLETTYFDWLRAGRPGREAYKMVVRRRGWEVRLS